MRWPSWMPGRDLDRQALQLHRAARSPAVRARTLDQAPGAAAVRAGLAAHELAEHTPRNLLQPTGSAARLARARAGPGLGALAGTALAGDNDLVGDLPRHARRGVDELDLDLCRDVRPRARRGRPPEPKRSSPKNAEKRSVRLPKSNCDALKLPPRSPAWPNRS